MYLETKDEVGQQMDEEGSGGEDEERSMEGPINKLDGERYLQLQILSFGKQV